MALHPSSNPSTSPNAGHAPQTQATPLDGHPARQHPPPPSACNAPMCRVNNPLCPVIPRLCADLGRVSPTGGLTGGAHGRADHDQDLRASRPADSPPRRAGGPRRRRPVAARPIRAEPSCAEPRRAATTSSRRRQSPITRNATVDDPPATPRPLRPGDQAERAQGRSRPAPPAQLRHPAPAGGRAHPAEMRAEREKIAAADHFSTYLNAY